MPRIMVNEFREMYDKLKERRVLEICRSVKDQLEMARPNGAIVHKKADPLVTIRTVLAQYETDYFPRRETFGDLMRRDAKICEKLLVYLIETGRQGALI
jgi:hypothetical protein